MRKFLKPPEVAKILGLSENTVRAAIKDGELPGLRFRGRFLIDREKFEQMMAGGDLRPARVATETGP